MWKCCLDTWFLIYVLNVLLSVRSMYIRMFPKDNLKPTLSVHAFGCKTVIFHARLHGTGGAFRCWTTPCWRKEKHVHTSNCPSSCTCEIESRRHPFIDVHFNIRVLNTSNNGQQSKAKRNKNLFRFWQDKIINDTCF